MSKILILTIAFFQIFGFYLVITKADVHVIKPKSNQCFTPYKENRPILIEDLKTSCIKSLPNRKNCLGLQLPTNDNLIVRCAGKTGKSKKLDQGCYTYVDVDDKENVVCQMYDEGKKCEVLKLPNGMDIDVYCDPLKPSGEIITIKQSTPKNI